jgi:endonuclease/exonuclease/phosphatase family metal-dependent hydrolase
MMKRPSLAPQAFRALLLVLALLCVASVARAADDEIKVMTYNLRYASRNPPNAWPDRRPLMKEVILAQSPDVIGTQEGVYYQLKELASDIPDYEWIGTGRDGGSRGEFMAVFYKRDRFEPLEFDHFWLSDTPDVIGSSTWGNSNRRMVTWVRFKDRVTGREFYFWNTHFDHQIQEAREKAAKLVRERVQALNTNLPVLLVGDFNSVAGRNPAYDILTGDEFFRDTWHLAGERRNETYNTFSGFRPARQDGQRIDWILARGAVDVRAIEIVTFQKNGQYPSDHFPVIAWLTLK